MQQAPPPGNPARAGTVPLLTQQELPTPAGGQHTGRVGVAAAAGVAFGSDQHVLAEGRQMTPAKGTAIGRGLVAGGPSHRPPWSRFKLRHAPILAPIGGALALAGLGAAAVLLLNRRAQQPPPARDVPDPPRRTTPKVGLPDRVQATILAQLDRAIGLLRDPSENPTEYTVHETRKALKRLRALIRLMRVQLGPKRFARENAILRDAGRRLAGARDAEVMLATLDELVARYPERLSKSAAIGRLRTQLLQQREQSAALALGEIDARASILTALAEVRARVADWRFDDGAEEALQLGLERLYREGRKRRARALKAGDTQALHDWRKRVKDLRYVAETLERPGRPGRGLRRVARRADRLGELLGREHDLAVLAALVRRERACFYGELATRKDLLRSIAKRRKLVHRRALAPGKELYSNKCPSSKG